MRDIGEQIATQLDRWRDDSPAVMVDLCGLGEQETGSSQRAEASARSILASIGYVVSEQKVLSPQGASSGMFSRRLAHVRLNLTARNAKDAAAAVIVHEAAHCLDRGPYDFDHPWALTPAEQLQAHAAQLVACFSSHAFTRSVLGLYPGPGQLALARTVTANIIDAGMMDDALSHDVGRRVSEVVAMLQSALAAPTWPRVPDREVAVDRGRGVMWLAIGPAAISGDPPSAPAELAAALSRQAQHRFRDDPRFTEDLDRSRPVSAD